MRLRLAHYSPSTARLALGLDSAALAPADIALHLHLLEDARGELCFLNDDALAVTPPAALAVAIFGPGALACVAHRLLL